MPTRCVRVCNELRGLTPTFVRHVRFGGYIYKMATSGLFKTWSPHARKVRRIAFAGSRVSIHLQPRVKGIGLTPKSPLQLRAMPDSAPIL